MEHETVDFDSQSREWANALRELGETYAGGNQSVEARIKEVGAQIDSIFGEKGMADVLQMLTGTGAKTAVNTCWQGVGTWDPAKHG